jgi:hypothetical protein
MPDTSDIDMPASGFDQNEGLREALRPGKYSILILNRLQDILDGMTDKTSRYYRADYVSSPAAVTITRRQSMQAADFQSNRVNVMNCGGQRVTLAAETFSNMVIIGYDCRFSMSNGTALENMTLITTSRDNRSIDSPQGFRMGADDNCGAGRDAQIVTWGGVRVAANLEMYGSQIIAAGPIDFAANASGIKGASMVSGATIDGTSNMSFGFCGTGMDNNFEAEYFRMRA